MIPLQDDTPSTTRPYVIYALIAVCAAPAVPLLKRRDLRLFAA
jgi:hypothetical protein